MVAARHVHVVQDNYQPLCQRVLASEQGTAYDAALEPTTSDVKVSTANSVGRNKLPFDHRKGACSFIFCKVFPVGVRGSILCALDFRSSRLQRRETQRRHVDQHSRLGTLPGKATGAVISAEHSV